MVKDGVIEWMHKEVGGWTVCVQADDEVDDNATEMCEVCGSMKVKLTKWTFSTGDEFICEDCYNAIMDALSHRRPAKHWVIGGRPPTRIRQTNVRKITSLKMWLKRKTNNRAIIKTAEKTPHFNAGDENV